MILFSKYTIIVSALISPIYLSAEKIPQASTILETAKKKLPSFGILMHSSGFVYLKVDDAYIHQLAPLLEPEGFDKPPYFGSPELVGAHISMIYYDEMISYGITNIEECGKVIPFVVKDCDIVPCQIPGIAYVYCIKVSIPLLDDLRKKYHLPPKKFDFHITIAAKTK